MREYLTYSELAKDAETRLTLQAKYAIVFTRVGKDLFADSGKPKLEVALEFAKQLIEH